MPAAGYRQLAHADNEVSCHLPPERPSVRRCVIRNGMHFAKDEMVIDAGEDSAWHRVASNSPAPLPQALPHYAALRSDMRERLDFTYSGCAIFSSGIFRLGISDHQAHLCCASVASHPSRRVKSTKTTALRGTGGPVFLQGFRSFPLDSTYAARCPVRRENRNSTFSCGAPHWGLGDAGLSLIDVML